MADKQDMSSILKALWFTPGLNNRWGLPVVFKGAPGTAKTATIHRVAKECGFHVETVLSSLRQPEDFLGLPIPVKNEQERDKLLKSMQGFKHKETAENEFTFTAVEYAPPRWAINLAVAKRGVVFFDEFNSAPPSVQAALLRVVLEGVVGELVLPPGIRTVACMNATEEAAGGHDIAPPLANRFGHFNWSVPDVRDWSSYMISLGNPNNSNTDPVIPENKEKKVEQEWNTHWSYASGLVTAFLRIRSNLLHQQPSINDPKASEAWPSPRSWEAATRALASARLHGMSGVNQFQMVAGFIGTGVASELDSFITNVDLPDIEGLLDGKVKWKHNPERLDRTCAVLSSATSYVISNHNKDGFKPRINKLWSLISNISKEAVDICMMPIESLVKANLLHGYTNDAQVAMLQNFELRTKAGG